MNRLTMKISEGFYTAPNIANTDDLKNKLGVLEDIEEELGIDLISAVNICKKVNNQKYVYVKESYGIRKLRILDNLDVELFNHRLYKNAYGIYVSLDLKDYDKTWSLVKENLEQ